MNGILNDKNNWEGYGEGSSQDVKELIKALQAQEGVTDIADLEGGGALQMQSLETQLAMLTFQEQHIKFFKDIGVVKAFSTLEEYSTQDGYGTEGGFVGQLENPEEDDAEINREFAVVKYIRNLWRTSDVLGYTKKISNDEVIQVQAAMMRTLRTLEKTLFFGDSDKVPQAFDGLERTILTKGDSYQVIDLRGATITEANMKQGAEVINANYGIPTIMYNSLGVQTTIDQIMGNTTNQRLNINDLKGNGSMSLGSSVSEMRTSFGNFQLKPDIFINPESQGVPTIKNPADKSQIIEGATSAKAPATPTFSLAVNAPTVAGSLWKTSGDGGAIAGAYKYRVAAINQYGKSQAAVAQSATVAANGAITITITAGAGAYAATAYEVYRETAPGSGIIKYLTTVKASVGSHQDLNADLSGTSKSFLIDNTTLGESRTMALAQLAPMHKVQYAKIAPYKWGAVNFYAVPKWYAPKRFVLYKNVGVQSLVRNDVIDL
jgi:hypothetical protein